MQLVAFYVVLTSIIAVVVAIKISIMTGLCAFGAAMLSATAGGGTKEGLRKWQGITSVGIVIIGVALFAFSYWLGHQFSLVLFGYHISGETWAIVGAVLGFFLA